MQINFIPHLSRQLNIYVNIRVSAHHLLQAYNHTIKSQYIYSTLHTAHYSNYFVIIVEPDLIATIERPRK